MSSSRQAAIWGIGLIIFGFALNVLAPVLLPFVAGFAIAYFLDPIVVWLGRHKVNRTVATLLVLVLFFAAIVLVFALVMPLVQGQIIEFARQLPELVRTLQERLMVFMAQLSAELSAADVERLKSAAGAVAGDALKFVGQLAGRAWSGGWAFINLLSLIFISPVVAFYVLRDWDDIVSKVDGWLPRDHADTIRRLVVDADAMIAGYMRGMAIVCLILATLYGVALSLIGLDFGLVIGLIAGLVSFIPFIGAAVGFIVAVGVAIAQFGAIGPIALTASVFIVGQILEGNFLTPKLVGERIRLHAVWVIFALLAGGLLFGFVGILLAVPAAAVIGVLARFFIGEYLQSTLYKGGGGDSDT
jgi:predicted PurR-regulated permease PerM